MKKMKVTIKEIIKEVIKESNDKRQRYYDKISKVMNPPYFADLQKLGVPQDEWEDVFKTLYKYDVLVDSFLDGRGKFRGIITDKKSNTLYSEGEGGNYDIREFDKDNNVTYHFKSDGKGNDSWSKSVFNGDEGLIYFENSKGRLMDKVKGIDINDPNPEYFEWH
jgi:hypothetical protein